MRTVLTKSQDRHMMTCGVYDSWVERIFKATISGKVRLIGSLVDVVWNTYIDKTSIVYDI